MPQPAGAQVSLLAHPAGHVMVLASGVEILTRPFADSWNVPSQAMLPTLWQLPLRMLQQQVAEAPKGWQSPQDPRVLKS